MKQVRLLTKYQGLLYRGIVVPDDEDEEPTFINGAYIMGGGAYVLDPIISKEHHTFAGSHLVLYTAFLKDRLSNGLTISDDVLTPASTADTSEEVDTILKHDTPGGGFEVFTAYDTPYLDEYSDICDLYT